MVNTRQKGNRIERKAVDALNEKGFKCARKQHTRYGNNDFYQLYDIIAVKTGAPFKCIQVKSNRPPNLTQFKKDAIEITPVEHAQIEIWTWYDYKGWKIRRLNSEKQEWEIIKDET